jgi:intein/homing endonuclease
MNHKHFPNWDAWRNWSPDLAYALGFIAADGYVGTGDYNMVRVCIAPRDAEVIEFLHARFGGGICVSRKKGYPIWYIHGKDFKDHIVSLGLVPLNKNRKKLPNVPLELMPHFIRGFFDGDGCVSLSYKKGRPHGIIAFAGYKEFIRSVSKVVSSSVRLIATTRDYVMPCSGSGVLYEFRLYSMDDVINVGDWMYSLPGMRLERKYTKFIQVKNTLLDHHNAPKLRREWLPEEIAALRRLYGKVPVNKLPALIGFSTEYGIQAKACALGLVSGINKWTFNGGWTDKERNYLRNVYGTVPASQIAECLGRSRSSVYQLAHWLGLTDRVGTNNVRSELVSQ